MFESHPRRLFFLRKSDCIGCAVLLCLVVCLTLLASFFLPSHLSLNMYVYVLVPRIVRVSATGNNVIVLINRDTASVLRGRRRGISA